MKRFCILLLVQVFIASLWAQPGRLDLSFNTFDNGQRGEGFNGEVRCAYGLPDGSVMAGGSFSGFSGSAVNRLIMLRPDGQRDPDFSLAGSGFNNSVNVVAPYTGGKWIVGGTFSSYNSSVTRRGIAMLNANGPLDAGFVPPATLGNNTIIKAIAVQPDGKILIGGDLVRTGGATRLGIIRLESNGSLDASFGSGNGVNIGADVNSILLQPDGKIIIGGDFNTYDGNTVGRICRLNDNGSLDASFNGGGNRFSNVGVVHSFLGQSGGTIIVGGAFDTYNGVESKGLVKLLSNGDMDNSFLSPYNGGPSASCLALAPHQDGTRFYAGGLLGTSAAGRHVALLTASGTIDPSFTAPLLLSNVTTIVPLSGGRIFISNGIQAASTYTNNTLTARRYSNRLMPDGKVDASYMQSGGAQSFSTSLAGITAIAVLPDDGIIIGSGGGFSNSTFFRYFNDSGRRTIARLKPNGELDAAFNADSGSNGVIHDIAVDPGSGRAIVVGDFTRFQGQSRQSIAMLLPIGKVDNSFLASGPAISGGTSIRIVRRLSDGKWLVAGQFKQFNGIAAYYLARLSENGELDEDFSNQVNTFFASDGVGLLYDVKVLPDGRFLACGSIGSLSGTGGSARPFVRLFNTNGTVDASFEPQFSANTGSINAVEWLGDGRVAIAGSFRFAQSPGSIRVAAVLLPNGTPDSDWAGTTRISGTINRLSLSPNGGLLLGGQNISYNDNGTNRIRRGLMMVNSFGAFVPSDFTADPLSEANAGIGKYYSTDADPFVEAIAFTQEGKLLIGGNFNRYGGMLKHAIARILLGPPDPEGLLKVCPGSNFTLPAPLTGTFYQWQAKPETGEWANIVDNAVYNGTQTAVLQFTNAPSNFYGYQFRCLVDGVPSSIVATLRFEVVWSGALNNDWSNTANWNCGKLPDTQTDVVLRYGAQVLVPSNTSVRSLRLQNGTSISMGNNVEFRVNN